MTPARRTTAALLGSAALACLGSSSPAFAAAAPGQAINNDYGQSPAEVAAEVSRQVASTPAVAAARARVTAAHRLVVARQAAEKRAASAAARAKAHTATVTAQAAQKRAVRALSAIMATTTKTVRARHYLPVDGTYTGTTAQYFIPGIGLEPIAVRITVYRGHVSDVSVPVYVSTGDSAEYNAMALPTLMQEAMRAKDRPKVALVSGATLTSEAFVKSLASALKQAGFPGR